MRLVKLHLQAFGPFTGRVLDFGSTGQGLALVHGLNEAGKSSALRAISDLRFGIHAQSKDNFVHSHGDMRIGGEFIDRAGVPYSFMRRKGRNGTLLQATFGVGAPVIGEVASMSHETLLTANLSRDAYETMFAMDHQRMRQGGEALLKGDGDVGAALFEASAGVRSIPQVLDQLDESARKYFMPGARGKNARINQAIGFFEEQNDAFKTSLVRPAQWTAAFKLAESAKAELRRLEDSRRGLAAKLLLLKELRAAAPLLTSLDAATFALEQLATTRMLPENASTERAAAAAGWLDAQRNVVDATAEAGRQASLLAALVPDAGILKMAAAIRRLETSSESVDQYQMAIADAVIDCQDAGRAAAEIAARIDAGAAVADLLTRAPSKSVRADIEATIRKLDLAQLALEQHRAAAQSAAVGAHDRLEAPPSEELRLALQVAQGEVVRNDAALQRLKALPAEIKAAERVGTNTLNALRLSDEAALREVRPMLSTQIDSALAEDGESTSRRRGLQQRIQEISEALPPALQRAQALSMGGALATRDDVSAARAQREQRWTHLRNAYIDKLATPEADRPMPGVFVDAVKEADRVVDAFANDTGRAAQLDAARKEVEVLEKDRSALQAEMDDLDSAGVLRLQNWNGVLARSGLPELPPAALREWQGLLPVASQALDQLRSRQDELQAGYDLERTLAAGVAAALVAFGDAPPAGASLNVLMATANTQEQTYKRREKAIDAARGEQLQKEKEERQRAQHEETLNLALVAAEALAAPMMKTLGLHAGASVEVAHARLAEFDELLQANARRVAADIEAKRAEQSLRILTDNVEFVRVQLNDAPAVDVRTYVDDILSRLEAATRIESARTLAEQCVSSAQENQRLHQATLERHEATLASLCASAAVDSAAMLPEAEENSRRKREAVNEIDRARKHLAAITARDEKALRMHLTDWDASSADTQEATLAHEQTQLDDRLHTARLTEESARRELEAIDSSDVAATAREGMEHAVARVRADMAPWIRSKLAHALLAEALKRFRERAQGPMLKAATTYFAKMTSGEFDRLVSDDSGKDPVLMAQRKGSTRPITVQEMSEGTRDQLYLALRLAALELQRNSGVSMPILLDDVLITSDEERSAATLGALAEFSVGTQVVVFTHHKHVADLATRHVRSDILTLVAI